MLAAAVAREAGELVVAGRRRGAPASSTKSTGTDMVTEFDTASEALIVERVGAARPHDAIAGEEGTRRPGSSGISWLVDPIDGTTNYLYGLAGYCVSIAAADRHGTLAGAVYLPVTGELFAAYRGGGATLDGIPIRCSDQTELGRALIGTGFAYEPGARARQGRRVAGVLPQVRDIRRLGAAAADLCLVACGRLDGYYEQYLNPWDLAAGELIAAEAGARLGTFPGARGEPAGVVASAPAIHDALVAALVGAT